VDKIEVKEKDGKKDKGKEKEKEKEVIIKKEKVEPSEHPSPLTSRVENLRYSFNHYLGLARRQPTTTTKPLVATESTDSVTTRARGRASATKSPSPQASSSNANKPAAPVKKKSVPAQAKADPVAKNPPAGAKKRKVNNYYDDKD
jgi:hypothetical protein